MLKRLLILVHRWLGVALCLLFLLWFPSGIGMMYWDYPGVSDGDRLEHSPTLDPLSNPLFTGRGLRARRRGSAADADSGSTHLTAAPVYRFGNGRDDSSSTPTPVSAGWTSRRLMRRVAAAWTGQPADAARIEAVDEVDQWTVQGRLRQRAASEVLMAGRPAGLRAEGLRRGRAVHDHGFAAGRLCRRHSALVLLHAAAPARPHGAAS